ncbi:MAG: SDR family NAD(P)-dependent oxidoreductase, partial [Chloroflexi bacterium]|nr:SDR family NAD(P)-dependent oxidoreductase [Chloroflexota bacterium]
MVLVTGGAGFIGANLTIALLERGYHVRVLDNLSTGGQRNLEGIERDVELVEGDIRDADTVRRAAAGVWGILHQAALPSVARSVADPVTSHQVNTTGTLNVLLAARDAGVQRLVYASSSSVYGDHPELPKVEERIGRPLSPYAASKLVDEVYARVYQSCFGVETVG